MITTMNEIEQRFDAIKDHKPKASKKLNELGEILASAYKINPDRADEMWQYLVELNVRDDEKNAKFYIIMQIGDVKNIEFFNSPSFYILLFLLLHIFLLD